MGKMIKVIFNFIVKELPRIVIYYLTAFALISLVAGIMYKDVRLLTLASVIFILVIISMFIVSLKSQLEKGTNIPVRRKRYTKQYDDSFAVRKDDYFESIQYLGELENYFESLGLTE
jgi:hypothetical protein